MGVEPASSRLPAERLNHQAQPVHTPFVRTARLILHCIVLYCIVLYCIVLCCVVLCCLVLCCVFIVLYCIDISIYLNLSK